MKNSILCILICSSMKVYATDSYEKTHSLDERQTQLTLRLRSIDHFRRISAEYSIIRDTRFYGDEGLKKRVEQWHSNFERYLNNWRNLAVLSNFSNPEQVAEFKTQLFARIGGLGDLKYSLDLEAREIAKKGEQLLAFLENLKNQEFYVDPAFRDSLRALRESIHRQFAAFEAMGRIVDPAHSKQRDSLVGKVEVAILNNIKRRALTFPELKNTVLEAESIIQGFSTIDPILHRANVIYSEVESARLANRVFFAEDKLRDLESFYAEAKGSLDKLSVAANLKAEAMVKLDNLIRTAQVSLRPILNSKRKFRMVESNLASQVSMFLKSCKKADQGARSLLNCELAYSLSNLNADHLKVLTDEELRHIEYQIERVKEGPLVNLGSRDATI